MRLLSEADRFGANTFLCLSLGFTLSALQAARRGHGVYARAVARSDFLSAAHDLHHAQCLDLRRRLLLDRRQRQLQQQEGGAAGRDIWEHTNEMKAALAKPQSAAAEVKRLFDLLDAFREEEKAAAAAAVAAATAAAAAAAAGSSSSSSSSAAPKKVIYDVGGRADRPTSPVLGQIGVNVVRGGCCRGVW